MTPSNPGPAGPVFTFQRPCVAGPDIAIGVAAAAAPTALASEQQQPAALQSPAAASQPAGANGRADAISLVEVSRRFGDFTAVRSITTSVAPGTLLGLIGPSGSGKTTIVRLLTGALGPSQGTVRVLGENPASFRRETRERIGYMPQLFVLYPDLTAEENVSFVGSLFGMLWRRRRRRVRETLELVGLWGVRRRRASQLSGGMKRRLELACALVHEPWVLFLDEPTAGIDPILRQQIWAELRRLRDTGRTLLVTTQYIGEAEYCDRIALLDEGRLLAFDTPEELRRRGLGGDVVEIQTARLAELALLADVPGVRTVRQRTPTSGFAIVEDAGPATSAIVERLKASGVEVASTREYRPPFEEIFAELVSREHAIRGDDGNDAGRARGKEERP